MTPHLRPEQSLPRDGGSAKPESISPGSYAFLQNYIHAESGIVIDADKRYLLESRLMPVLRDAKLGSLDELTAKLASKSSPSLGRLVIEAMTTHETLFFRDPVVFEGLREHVLPAMLKRAAGARKVRIWSAAASTGQEAYSLAMLLLEMGRSPSEFEIVGTDISAQVLERARAGRYGQFDVKRGLKESLLKAYFDRCDHEWQVKEHVRKLVRFQQLDLRGELQSLGSFDLVLCRNVLIYFDTKTKRRIVESIRRCLEPEGVLGFGCAETIINIHDGLHRKVNGLFTCYSA